MEYTPDNLQKFIAKKLLAYYEQRITKTMTLHLLLVDIVNEFDIYITPKDNDGKCAVKGRTLDCGYNIVMDSVFLINRMVKANIVQYFWQGNNTPYTLDGIGKSDGKDIFCGYISGTAVEYITEHGGQSLWISPEIINFEKNGFVSEELCIARKQMQEARQQTIEAQKQVEQSLKQTKYAGRTLMCSIITLLVSILTVFVSIISMIASICMPFVIEMVSKCCH